MAKVGYHVRLPGWRWIGRGARGADTYQDLRTGRIYRFWPGPGGHHARPVGRGFVFPSGLRAVVREGPRVTVVHHPDFPPERFGGEDVEEFGFGPTRSFDGTSLALGVVGLLATAGLVATFLAGASRQASTIRSGFKGLRVGYRKIR